MVADNKGLTAKELVQFLLSTQSGIIEDFTEQQNLHESSQRQAKFTRDKESDLGLIVKVNNDARNTLCCNGKVLFKQCCPMTLLLVQLLLDCICRMLMGLESCTTIQTQMVSI